VSQAIKKAKQKALYTLKVSNVVEDRHLQKVFSLYNSYENKDIDDALEEVGLGDRDLIDLNNAQLQKLINYMRTEKFRQQIRIGATPAN
jgi:hypothetical protein